MKFKLNDSYQRDFLVSQNGNTYKKGVITEVEVLSWEDERYLEQKFIVPVGDVDEAEIKKLTAENLMQEKQEADIRKQLEVNRKLAQEKKFKEEILSKAASTMMEEVKEEEKKEVKEEEKKEVKEEAIFS